MEVRTEGKINSSISIGVKDRELGAIVIIKKETDLLNGIIVKLMVDVNPLVSFNNKED